MCGIFGIFSRSRTLVPDEARLRESISLLGHRGPDSHGVYAGDSVGLAHTRLSLLDLSAAADQPFWDHQRRYCLVYNGEIYNFKEIKQELEKSGVPFRTTSDTEVLLEALIHFGPEVTLQKLEGMFAFGFLDTTTEKLVIARDRFGIKPLFIYDDQDTLIFASEINAMRPWMPLSCDTHSIASFLFGFHGPTKGASFYEGIRFLPPGSLVIASKNQTADYRQFAAIKDLWNADDAEKLKTIRVQDAVDLVDEQLCQSVKSQLVADAPVGALCSGGLDSSIILAIAAKYHNNLAIFHANVIGKNSELPEAKRLSKHLGLDLKVIDVRDQDFVDGMPEIAEHYGHPFYHTPHSVPFFMVAKLVRHHKVKAVLSGEGADECFLGYEWLAPDVHKWKKYLKRLIHRRPGSDNVFQGHYLRRDSMLSLFNHFEVDMERQILFDRVMQGGFDKGKEKYILSLDLLNYNLRALLHRNDSMGMAAGIESRFPFLATELVRFAVNLPFHLKVRFSPLVYDPHHPFFTDKWLLRKVAERYLPRTIIKTLKRPFPVDAYNRLQISPLFFKDSFVSDFFQLRENEAGYLVTHAAQDLKLKLLHLEVWGQVCLHGRRPAISDKLRRYVSVRP